jgi:hypothetical protein
MSSLVGALNQIKIQDTKIIDNYIVAIITAMSVSSEEGMKYLYYDLDTVNKYLIQQIINGLREYFPDIIVKANTNRLFIDWS